MDTHVAATNEYTACTVWGTAARPSAPHAALVNGMLIQGFELDDVHRAGVLHVGAVTLPGLLAVAEIRPGLSGRELLTAAFVRVSGVKMPEAEIEAMLADPETQFTTEPRGVMGYAELLSAVGLIKVKPAGWSELFVPALHGRAGS